MIENGTGGTDSVRTDAEERNKLKRAKNKLKQDKKTEESRKAAGAGRQALAIMDVERPPKGKGKGAKGKKGVIPKGIKSRTDENEFVCFAHNRGEGCKSSPCTFKHVCWWCNEAGCPKTGSMTKSCC